MSPSRRTGVRGAVCVLAACMLSLACILATDLITRKPAYQVNSNPGDEGSEVEGDPADRKEEEEPLPSPWSKRRILSMLLVSMYVCLFLYLALEVQRKAKRILRVRSFIRSRNEVKLGAYAAEMERILKTAKVGRYVWGGGENSCLMRDIRWNTLLGSFQMLCIGRKGSGAGSR